MVDIFRYIYIYVVIFSLCRLVHKVKSLGVVWLWSLSRQTGRGGAYVGPADWCKGVAQWLQWLQNLHKKKNSDSRERQKLVFVFSNIYLPRTLALVWKMEHFHCF